MYLSMVQLPDGVPPYCVHQYLYGYFPQISNTGKRPFLFREMSDGILMLSSIQPACKHIDISGGIEAGRSYSFDAVINPAGRFDGKRRAVYGNQERKDWFVERVKGAQVGFIQVFDMQPRRFRRADGDYVFFERSNIKGMLCVTNADEFRAWMLSPPGKAKVFGCGLVVLPDIMRHIIKEISH